MVAQQTVSCIISVLEPLKIFCLRLLEVFVWPHASTLYNEDNI